MKLQSTIKRFGILALALTAPTLAAVAGTMDYSSKASKEVPAPPVIEEVCFEAGELQLDLFAGYVWAEGGHDDSATGGVGINYFFTEMVGVGVDAHWWDGDGTIHSFSGSLIVRFPIQEICLAPYIYGGGGFDVNSEQYGSVHAGAGIEYRISDSIGVFADGRYTWGEDEYDDAMARGGIRFVF